MEVINGGSDISDHKRARIFSIYLDAQMKVKPLADRVIEAYHPHLVDARIKYLFRKGAWDVRGRTVTGKTVIAKDILKYITELDLIVVLNKKVFNSQTDEGKLALLDDKFSDINPPYRGALGELIFTHKCHDIIEHSEVVKRHNIAFSNLAALADGGVQLSINSLENVNPVERPPEDKPRKKLNLDEEDMEEIYIDDITNLPGF